MLGDGEVQVYAVDKLKQFFFRSLTQKKMTKLKKLFISKMDLSKEINISTSGLSRKA